MKDRNSTPVSRDAFPPDLVVSAAHLLDNPSRNRLYIDVRLGEPEDEYLDFYKCHIHGAIHAQIRDVFASTPTESTGNLPLPDVTELEGRLMGWGVDKDTELVVYGRSPAMAARGWWTLTWAGLGLSTSGYWMAGYVRGRKPAAPSPRVSSRCLRDVANC